jgi:hypothetical protein
MQAGDVEVARADGSHHSHQDRTVGPIKTIPWRVLYPALAPDLNVPLVPPGLRVGGGSG